MQNPIVLIVLLIVSVIALIAAAVISIRVLRKAHGVESDKQAQHPAAGKMPNDEHKGREAVIRQLNRYASLHDYKVVSPITLTGTHGTTDLDAVLIGWFGILGVKCLGYGGDIYGSLDEESWVQTMANARRSFQNPMTRAQQSTRVIRDVLFEAKLKNIPVETVVVFTGKSTQLMLPRSTGHYTEKSFSAYLKTMHFEEDRKVEIEPIFKLFSEKKAQ